MTDYIKKIRTTDGDKQIDYRALANLPTLVELTNDLSEADKAPNTTVVNAKLKNLEMRIEEYINSAINDSANAIKGYVSDTVVQINDISPFEHTLNVRVSGKNVIPYPYEKNSSTTSGGTFEVLTDGGIKGSGTPTDYCDIYVYDGKPLVTKGTITMSLSGTYTNMITTLALFDNDETQILEKNCDATPIQINLDDYPTTSRWLVVIKRKSIGVEMSGVAYLQIEKGNSPTTYELYHDPSSIILTAYGVDETDNPQNYTPNVEGICEITPIKPTMTMVTNVENATIEVEYSKDSNAVITKIIEAIIKLGGTI